MKVLNFERAAEIQQYLEEFVRQKKERPSVREVAEFFGVSKSVAHRYLRALNEAGAITYENGKLGGPVIEAALRGYLRIPLLGSVSCGSPWEEEEEIIDYVLIPEHTLNDGHYFALQAKGESMIDAGILPGDTVICEKIDPSAYKDGDIVAALTNGTASNLKVMHRVENGIELEAMNPDKETYPTVVYQDIQLQGRLVFLQRSYGR